MRGLFISLCLCCCLPAAFAADDYVVLKNGDTVHGKVRSRWSPGKGSSVKVKHADGKKIYPMAEVSSFTSKGEKYMFFTTIHSRKPVHTEALEVVEEGTVKLLLNYCRYSRYMYDLYVLLEDGRLVYVWEESYKNTLLHHFNQSPAFRRDVSEAQLQYSRKRKGHLDRIREVVRLYNKG